MLKVPETEDSASIKKEKKGDKAAKAAKVRMRRMVDFETGEPSDDKRRVVTLAAFISCRKKRAPDTQRGEEVAKKRKKIRTQKRVTQSSTADTLEEFIQPVPSAPVAKVLTPMETLAVSGYMENSSRVESNQPGYENGIWHQLNSQFIEDANSRIVNAAPEFPDSISTAKEYNPAAEDSLNQKNFNDSPLVPEQDLFLDVFDSGLEELPFLLGVDEYCLENSFSDDQKPEIENSSNPYSFFMQGKKPLKKQTLQQPTPKEPLPPDNRSFSGNSLSRQF